MKGEGFKIRYREVIAKRPVYGRFSEYQVVSRAKIVGRFDLLSQAQRQYPGAELDSSVIHEDAVRKAAARGKA